MRALRDERDGEPASASRARAHRSRGRQRPQPARYARELQAGGEIVHPLLGRAEEQLGLLGAQRVPMQHVLDDVAGAAVELVRRDRDVAVGARRPRLRDRDLALGRLALAEAPERLARDVARALELDRHDGDHLLHRLERRRASPRTARARRRSATVISSTASAPPTRSAAQQRREHAAELLEPRPRGARGAPASAVAAASTSLEADDALPVLRRACASGSTVTPGVSRGTSTSDDALAVARGDEERVGRHALQHAASSRRSSTSIRARGGASVGRERARIARRVALGERERHELLAARDRRAATRASAPRVPSASSARPPAKLAKMPNGADGAPALLDQEAELEERRALPAVLPRACRSRTSRGRRPPARTSASWPARCLSHVEPALARDLGREEPPRLAAGRRCCSSVGARCMATSAAARARAAR